MATETNISTLDENGAVVCRPMTEEELAELEATRATLPVNFYNASQMASSGDEQHE